MTLELRDVTAGYGPHTVLRDVDLVVPSGTVVALLGANGAGKTTLLRVAAGLLAPSTGTVRLHGRDVVGLPPSRRARMGLCLVPEGRGVFASMSVADNLTLGLLPGQERGAIDAALAAFPRLAERRAQTAGTMSGGEQQMLALAPAYLSAPDVVLLDEVSMGLAPNLVDEIYEHLHELARTGVSMLLVEQFVTRALDIADIVVVLRKGRVAFVGEPSELGDDDVLATYLGGVA